MCLIDTDVSLEIFGLWSECGNERRSSPTLANKTNRKGFCLMVNDARTHSLAME
jgi:hypothetical protein